MKKKAILTLGISLMLTMSLLLGGCGSKKDASEEKTAEEKAEKQEEVLKNIGTEAEGDNIYKVMLENKTGKDITGFAVKDSSMAEYPANMLADGDAFTDGEKRYLFYDASSAAEATETQTAQSGESANALTPQMDVQLTFEDQTSMVLTAFPFGDVEEAQICLEDEVAFIQYESLSTKETMSTKEAELTIKADAEAAAQAEAEAAAQAQAEAEEAAAAQAQAEAEAAAAAQAQAEAAAAAQAQAEAEAAAAAQAEAARQQQAAQQQQQQQAPSTSGDGCMNGALVY